ncbi:MAG: hypothetical protein MRZ62_03785 [Brachyspira sp.]|nr:hypothetical protein [Brachyspira sp.]
MKVQQITPQYIQQNKQKQQSQPRFTGAPETAATLLLRFLDTNQAIGANSVDLCSMVIPRTVYDFHKRGADAGVETARRESMGTINHSLVGVYGTLGGMLVASALNRRFKNDNLRVDKLFADNATTDILARYRLNSLRKEPKPEVSNVKSYLNAVFDNLKVYNPANKDAVDGWVGIKGKERDLVIEKLEDLLKNGKKDQIDKDSLNYIKNLLVSSTGGEKQVKLEFFKDGKLEKKATNNLSTFIENLHNVSKVYMKKDIEEIFKNSVDIDSNAFVNALKSMNLKRSVIGLGIATAIGVSTQPINKYLTFKKTGQTGFVGVEGREEDHSTKFKIMKTVAGILLAGAAISTITTKPSEFLSKIQFKGMLPTVDQLKLVYGMTIGSRLLAARDKDELRESAIKDSLGFLNLLVLGALVAKGSAKLLDKSKSLITLKPNSGKGFVNWLKNSTLRNRDEVLLTELKAHGKEVIKDGKALTFKELMKLSETLPTDVQKSLKGKLRVLNLSQAIGYLYSGLVLGVGVPALNAHMTAKSDAKYKAIAEAKKKAAGEQNQTAQAPATQQVSMQNFTSLQPMLQEQNKAFVEKHM